MTDLTFNDLTLHRDGLAISVDDDLADAVFAFVARDLFRRRRRCGRRRCRGYRRRGCLVGGKRRRRLVVDRCRWRNGWRHLQVKNCLFGLLVPANLTSLFLLDKLHVHGVYTHMVKGNYHRKLPSCLAGLYLVVWLNIRITTVLLFWLNKNESNRRRSAVQQYFPLNKLQRLPTL